MISLDSLAAYLPNLESTIAPNPPLVTPETLLLEVITLMSQSPYQQCWLPGDETLHEQGLLHQPTSAVLVVEGAQLVGIFTERDLVELTASETQWRSLTIGQVMTSPVIALTKTPNQSLLSALSLFREYKIRHLPVLNEQGQILGLICSSSIRKALQPLNLLKWKVVRDVMAHEVISAPAATSVLSLTQLMIRHQISSIVLTQPHPQFSHLLQPVGMITERDIVQFQALDLNLTQLSAEAVMSAPLFSVHPREPLLAAQHLMQKHRIRRLVVIGDRGELQGIITQGNLLRVFDPLEMYELLEFLNQTVEQRTSELQQTNQKLQAEIIEREAVEIQLRQTLTKEQELNQFRTYITAMASHDLRVPLTSISLATELLKKHPSLPSEKQQQYLERIQFALKQMTFLLNDILTLSETEPGHIQLKLTPLELIHFCQNLIEDLQLATQSKCRVQFTSAVSHYLIQADEKILRQILVNLLSNAIKYSPARTTVQFQLSLEAEVLVFRIQDQGIGIPPADQARLFSPFFRASNVSKFEGTGLGLSIVKRYVDALQGSLELSSTIGEGTTVVVKLPSVG